MPHDPMHCGDHSRIAGLVSDMSHQLKSCQDSVAALRERCARQDEANKPLHEAIRNLTDAFRDFVKKVDQLETKLDKLEGGMNMLRNLLMLMFSAGGVALLVGVAHIIEKAR